MSNSIWKTGDPTYRNDNFDEIIVREYKRWAADGVFYLVDYCTELPNRWAYLLDIIAQADKAERLQKAVDIGVCALRELAVDPYSVEEHIFILKALEKIEQLTQGE